MLALCACGPKEPGEGLATEMPDSRGGYSAAENMRLPLTGTNHNERLLYHYNRPELIENMQRWRNEQFRRHTGEEAQPVAPAFNGLQRAPSPFRQ